MFKHKRSKSQGGETDLDSIDWFNKSSKGSAPTELYEPEFGPIDPIVDLPPFPRVLPKEFTETEVDEQEGDSLGAKKKKKKGIESIVRSVIIQHYEPRIESLQQEVEQAREKLAHLNTVSKSFHYDAKKDKLILPPETIRSVDAAKSVDRNAKVKHLFSHIPHFDPNDSSIRDWLENVNSAVNNADYKLTEGELKSIIITRLSDKVRAMLSPWERTKKELYDDLVSHFDKSETPEQAQTKLCTMKPDKRVHTLFEFFYEAKRLLKLCPTQDPRLFTMALSSFVPEEIDRQIKEKILKYKAHGGEDSYPDINDIINFVVSHRDRIDDYLEEQVKGGKKIRSVNAVEGKTRNRATDRTYECVHCRRPNHKSEDCYSLRICLRCGRKGHEASVCKNKGCIKCGKATHVYTKCDLYPEDMCAVSTAPCSFCKKLNGLPLMHPESVCVVRSVMEKATKN